MFDDFMTVDVMSTFVGLSTAVMLIVQFTKSLVKRRFGDSFVRLYAFVIALLLTFIFAKQGNSVQGIVLTVINAIIITLASIGGYEIVSDPMAQKK
ncbi:MAG: hypothetical protein RIN55_00105 [Tissierellaceae bacterium]|nr:hypothetical protein [Tissierellaceae bacterium]